MNPFWEEAEASDGEEEGEYETHRSERDALIFLIDAAKEMFVTSGEESPFHMAIKCAHSTLSNKVISSDKDLVAIVFFGTEKSKNTSNFKHIYEFQNLSQPGAERIRDVEELMKCDAESFKEKYGHNNQFSFSDVLWTCSIMYSHCKMKLDHKRLLVFTNVDNPHVNNNKLHQLAKAKAKDLFDLGIDIDLLPIQTQEKNFDINSFYKDIIHISDDEVAAFSDPSERFEELLTRVRVKDHKKRAQALLLFTLGEGLQMGVGVYNLILPLKKPSAVKLNKSNNAEIRSMTKSYLGDTGEILMPSDKIAYQEYGGKKIFLELDETKQLKYLGEPGLLLMGFKPIETLKPHHHYQPSKFIYPDEKLITGSTRLFSALLQQCNKRKCMAICRLIMRTNQPPKFVALVPQEEELDEHSVQISPSGFHMFFLPFMEDIRSLSLEAKHPKKDQLIEKAKDIIKKLQFTYNPESFENPVLQKHWRNIEALALNRDAPDEMTDYTKMSRVPVTKTKFSIDDLYPAVWQTIDDTDITELLCMVETSSEYSSFDSSDDETPDEYDLKEIPLPPDPVPANHQLTQDTEMEEIVLLTGTVSLIANQQTTQHIEIPEVPCSTKSVLWPIPSSQPPIQQESNSEMKEGQLQNDISTTTSVVDQTSHQTLEETETQEVFFPIEASQIEDSFSEIKQIEQETGPEPKITNSMLEQEIVTVENCKLENDQPLSTLLLENTIEHDMLRLGQEKVTEMKEGNILMDKYHPTTPSSPQILDQNNCRKRLRQEQRSSPGMQEEPVLKSEHRSESSPLPDSSEEQGNSHKRLRLEQELVTETEEFKLITEQEISSVCSKVKNGNEMNAKNEFVIDADKVSNELKSSSLLQTPEEQNNFKTRLKPDQEFFMEIDGEHKLSNGLQPSSLSPNCLKDICEVEVKSNNEPVVVSETQSHIKGELQLSTPPPKYSNEQNEKEVGPGNILIMETENQIEAGNNQLATLPSSCSTEQNEVEVRLEQEAVIETSIPQIISCSAEQNEVEMRLEQESVVETSIPQIISESQLSILPTSCSIEHNEAEVRLEQESLIEASIPQKIIHEHQLFTLPPSCSAEQNEAEVRLEQEVTEISIPHKRISDQDSPPSSLPDLNKGKKPEYDRLLKIEEEEHRLRIELQKQRLHNEAELHQLEMEMALIENNYWKKMLCSLPSQ